MITSDILKYVQIGKNINVKINDYNGVILAQINSERKITYNTLFKESILHETISKIETLAERYDEFDIEDTSKRFMTLRPHIKSHDIISCIYDDNSYIVLDIKDSLVSCTQIDNDNISEFEINQIILNNNFDSKMYYLQIVNKNSTVVYWLKSDGETTNNIDEAGTFDFTKASIIKSNGNNIKIWSYSYINKRLDKYLIKCVSVDIFQ